MEHAYPSSPLCTPLSLQSDHFAAAKALCFPGMTPAFSEGRLLLPEGEDVFWGIPFASGRYLAAFQRERVMVEGGTKGCPYLVFLHTADQKKALSDEQGFLSPMRGNPILGEAAGEYILKSRGGKTVACPLRRRFNIAEITHTWGEENFQCVPHLKARTVEPDSEAKGAGREGKVVWGISQCRVEGAARLNGNLYLYALENPFPDDELMEIEVRPAEGAVVVLAAVTACGTKTSPLLWNTRKKAKLTALPGSSALPSTESQEALSDFFTLDMGTIISASPLMEYQNDAWESRYNNQPPIGKRDEVLIEYTSHPDAILHFSSHASLPVSQLEATPRQVGSFLCCEVAQQNRPVKIRVLDQATGQPVPVKFHAHGEVGEYLAPADRHRIPNPYWFEDYSPDFVHYGTDGRHCCCYISGEASLLLPLGRVYIEIAKGFEIEPLHRCFTITPDTRELTITLQKVLRWREKGWITADTHVHFLSPATALLEGEAEGVNVVNLLASQWGELFTNVGDFDGRSVFGSREGDYMVRVGTENRQHTLGHISLLGYEGSMILPLATGGPDESALGDGLETGLMSWARQVREQNGLAIIPHLPGPRAENAAVIAAGYADGVEMTSWGDLYGGLSPYALSDWYRFLNCGYLVPAVGGTDKMSATTAVGTVRTYSYIGDALISYEEWKRSVQRGNTFVTYGPLLDFHVEGAGCGETLRLPSTGGTLGVSFAAATCTVPISTIELVVNGELYAQRAIPSGNRESFGSFELKTRKSCWAALRVRGGYPDKPEVILAHSSAVLILVDEQPCFSAPDAMTILEQIEGATAYIKGFSNGQEERKFKEMLLQLVSVHRELHNRMHQSGVYHHHTAPDDHPEHHQRHSHHTGG